jgi:hypothetical protein
VKIIEVVIELLRYSLGFFASVLVRRAGKGQAALVRAGGIKGQISAGMSGADLEPGKGIERSLKNQVRECDCRLQRVTDHVLQHSVALQPAAGAEFGCALWVNENHYAELFGVSPKRMEFGIRQLLAVDAAADQRTELEFLARSQSAQAALTKNYVGLPY